MISWVVVLLLLYFCIIFVIFIIIFIILFIILIIIIFTTTTIIITNVLLIKAGTAGACFPSSVGKAISVCEALPQCVQITKPPIPVSLAFPPPQPLPGMQSVARIHPTDNWLMMTVTSDVAASCQPA